MCGCQEFGLLADGLDLFRKDDRAESIEEGLGVLDSWGFLRSDWSLRWRMIW